MTLIDKLNQATDTAWDALRTARLVRTNMDIHAEDYDWQCIEKTVEALEKAYVELAAAKAAWG